MWVEESARLLASEKTSGTKIPPFCIHCSRLELKKSEGVEAFCKLTIDFTNVRTLITFSTGMDFSIIFFAVFPNCKSYFEEWLDYILYT